MARIIAPDGTVMQDFAVIQKRLSGLGIALKTWPVPGDSRPCALLDQKSLSDPEKEELLATMDGRFEELKRTNGYQTRDLIVIHEDIPGLPGMLAKFDKIHYHTDDEVRYIVSGHGYFGFVEANGDQFLVEVSAGDYINVPAYTEHWFEMKDSKRIKAVRYFIDTAGWVPVYTEREMLFA